MACSTPVIRRDWRGSTQGAVRWNRLSEPTVGAICGTNWIAEAPVPMTATRAPVRSTSWRHCAEWNAVPAKVDSPGMSGVDGRLSGPVATTRTRAVYSPREVRTRHRPIEPSQSAPSSSWPSRRCGVTPKRTAVARRYAQISGCPEKVSDQDGLRAKENEYRCDGTSQAQPG